MRIFLCMLACAAALFASGEHSGRRAPGFSLPDMNLKQYDPQDFRGKVLVVEFMQTTCPHCELFSHFLEKGEKKSAGGVVIFPFVNPPENANNEKKYMREKNLPVPF